MVKKKRLPVKGRFADDADRGEKLKEAGKRDFESVYGPKTPGAFNMTDDINAMNGVIAMTKETKNLADGVSAAASTDELYAPATPADELAFKMAGFKAPDTAMPKVDTTMPDIPTSNLGPDNTAPEEENEEEEEKKPLTTKEKAEELVKFVKAVTGNEIPVDTILAWKQMHGDIFMLHLGEKVFLFRYLKRQEMIQMKANPKYEEMSEDQREEDIYNRCLLFPRVDGVRQAADAAGTMGLIANQVKLQSLFLDEMYVAQMVIKI